MTALAAAALALWGWGGMILTVIIGIPAETNWAAQAQPSADRTACTITIHPNLPADYYPAYLLHETGHCIGLYEHSADTHSIMHRQGAATSGTTITRADRLHAISARGHLTSRIIIPEVSR